jgi:hypothetical protein
VLTPCLHPGCPELLDVDLDGRYCPRHANDVRPRRAPDTRPTRGRPWSRNAWRQASRARRSRFPVCEVCRQRPSELVHHLIPAREQLLPGRDHLAACCRKCHAQIEAALARGERLTTLADLQRVVSRSQR